MAHKTKQAALKAARDVLGDDAIEGVDFNITNTGAGWAHETIPPANAAAAASQGARLKLVKTDEAPAPGQAAADAQAHVADAAKPPPAHKAKPQAPKKATAPKKDRAAKAEKFGAKIKAIGEKHGQTKGAMIQAMLSTPGGATSKEMEAATGWQPHSVRGFLGTLRKAGINVISKKLPKEPTIYRIEAKGGAGQSADSEVL